MLDSSSCGGSTHDLTLTLIISQRAHTLILHLGLGALHMGLGEHDSVYSTESGDEGRAGRGRTSLSASTAALSTLLLKQRLGDGVRVLPLQARSPSFPTGPVPAYVGPLPPELVGGPTTARCSGGHSSRWPPSRCVGRGARVGRSRWLH